MRDKRKSRWLQGCRLTLSALALGQFTASPVLAQEWEHHHGGHETLTPIKHVIVIIGENRSFDHVFATYVPERSGESVMNLLSQGIVPPLVIWKGPAGSVLTSLMRWSGVCEVWPVPPVRRYW